jgi:hypothetical protein
MLLKTRFLFLKPLERHDRGLSHRPELGGTLRTLAIGTLRGIQLATTTRIW